jgi:DNA-binding transcriptional LysR family regulator
MQQPPLSQQIKALEQELGVQLFRRKARGVELTEAGQSLLEEARAILARLGRAVETTRRIARGEQGRLCVGIPPTGPFHPFVPGVIRAFREAFPLVSVTLEECLRTETIQRLQDERMDVAFLRVSIAAPEGLVIHPLLEEPMVIALPAAHRLAGCSGEALCLKDLVGETFVVYARQQGPASYEALLAACHQAGFSPRFGQEAPRVTTALGLVAAGLGVSLVPASMQRMTMDGVTYRPLAGAPGPTVALTLASRRGDPSPGVRHFVELVRRAARDIGAGRGRQPSCA